MTTESADVLNARQRVKTCHNAVGLAESRLTQEKANLKTAQATLSKLKKRKVKDNQSNPAPKKKKSK